MYIPIKNHQMDNNNDTKNMLALLACFALSLFLMAYAHSAIISTLDLYI